MKKVVLLLFAFGALAINAQDLTRNGANGSTLKSNDWSFMYTGEASDTLTTNQDSISVAWFINKPQSQFYDFYVVLDETTAGGQANISLQGKKFKDQAWTNITTTKYWGSLSTGADTTILFSQTSTKQFYNYYRVLGVFLATKTKIVEIRGSVKNQ